MQMNSFFKKARLWIVAVPVGLFSIIVLVRFGKLAFSPQKSLLPVKPAVERGSIVDRNGKPLAVQTNFYHFGVSPETLSPALFDEFAGLVAPVLNANASEISATLLASKEKNFVYIRKKITEEQYEELSKIVEKNDTYVAAVRFDRIPGRVYPENDLASQLIGYMGDDGTGLSGVEYSEQSVLSPPVDSKSPKTIAGKNIYLTIDANLQYKLEKIAKDAMASTQAESIMLIAAEAKTGEILTYLSLPSANLNAYGSASIEETVDRPAVNAYEPGSVFKIFSVASFLDANVITPDTIFMCDGLYEKTTSSGERIKITWWFETNCRDAEKVGVHTYSLTRQSLAIKGITPADTQAILSKDIADTQKSDFFYRAKQNSLLLRKTDKPPFAEVLADFENDLDTLIQLAKKALSLCEAVLRDRTKAQTAAQKLTAIDNEILCSASKNAASLVFPTERQLEQEADSLPHDKALYSFYYSRLIYQKLQTAAKEYLSTLNLLKIQ